MANQKIIVRQTRSANRQPSKHLKTLQALGLGRIGKSKLHESTPSLMGMVKSVCHLVEIDKVK
ncbi:MAG: 50S ribosomal protein L30 [Deltaproteobacteria bacterium]|nr:50S ribosomal protein L30 [Deltaproteobacteria bacterium]